MDECKPLLWGISVAYLGVFFAVPLRSHFLLESKLRFPSGTATAETIGSMFADPLRAKEQVNTLLTASAIAAAMTFATWAVPWQGLTLVHGSAQLEQLRDVFMSRIKLYGGQKSSS